MHGTDGFPDGWWAQERIILAIQSYAQLYGAAPSADEWAPARARRTGRPVLAERFTSDACWPSHYTVIRKFKNWNAAIEAAGFVPRPVGRPVGGWLPERCGRGHLFSEHGYYKTRRATAKRPAYTVRACRLCRREDYQRAREQLGEP